MRVVHPQFVQQFPNLQAIHLNDASVEYLVPDSFANCGELTTLHLGRNEITSFPPGVFRNCDKLSLLSSVSNSISLIDRELFFGLQNLRTLSLGRVILSSNAFEYVPMLQSLILINAEELEPETLHRLTLLEEITISNSLISLNVIQNAINGLDLQRITLAGNGFTRVNFTFFEQFSQLHWFDLSRNELTTIPENSFQNYRELNVLLLHYNHIATVTDTSFAGLHNLSGFMLNQNRLVRLLPNVFSDMKNITSLDLSNNNIQAIDPGAFNGLKRVVHLTLDNLQLTTLTSGIFEPLHSLRSLFIRGSHITTISPNVFPSSETLPSLRDLDLSRNAIRRLNSNSFSYLPSLQRFSIGSARWEQGVNEIEPNFFENVPNVQFGTLFNVCFDGIVNVTLLDFRDVTVFEQCFANWEGRDPRTPGKGAVIVAAKLWVFAMMIVIKAV